jgi:predicted Rossmann fold nucleotide-binding protein DprA/Smf involved in DNA uptake
LKPEDLLSSQLNTLLSGLSDKEITIERLAALLDRGTALAVLMDKWSRAGLWVLTRAEPDYPLKLKNRLEASSPAVLFGCGNRKLLSGGGLAIVGSRKAGNEDLSFSRQLGALAANSGYSVVSGGARGVDEAAMLGTLEAEGTAVGVLAGDLLKASGNRKYHDHIVHNNLVLVSSTNPEAGFDVGNAMQRNKYIYCLADAAVVVHCGKKGGTWTGAQENLKRRWVPLWVKDTTDPEAGNRDLLENSDAKPLPSNLSGIPFAILFPQKDDHLRLADSPSGRVLSGRERKKEMSLSVQSESESHAVALEISFYELFLNKLQELCRDTPREAKELIKAFDLHKTQLNVWLKKAVAEGKITKLSRPVRYQCVRQGKMFIE